MVADFVPTNLSQAIQGWVRRPYTLVPGSGSARPRGDTGGSAAGVILDHEHPAFPVDLPRTWQALTLHAPRGDSTDSLLLLLGQRVAGGLNPGASHQATLRGRPDVT